MFFPVQEGIGSPVSRYPWKAVIPILLVILLYISWKSNVSFGKLLFSIIVLFSYSFVPLEGDTLKLSLMLSQENWEAVIPQEAIVPP